MGMTVPKIVEFEGEALKFDRPVSFCPPAAPLPHEPWFRQRVLLEEFEQQAGDFLFARLRRVRVTVAQGLLSVLSCSV